MSRKSRLGEESRGHRVPAEGSGVFAQGPDDARSVKIGGIVNLKGERVGLKVRWPAGVPMSTTPWPPEPEIIDLKSLPRSTKVWADPYAEAELRAAERKAQRESAA